ncbi:hypothetical protein E2C01_002760 [Portunus trituberculatus]|uniref:Uncharacterized protein n=1 Tax=Portunus trituberculatus TaxID=210409 RepID=A0A5B7CMS4_PORTR|nr:hypothetical protein [Portunus trituberculatus]
MLTHITKSPHITPPSLQPLSTHLLPPATTPLTAHSPAECAGGRPNTHSEGSLLGWVLSYDGVEQSGTHRVGGGVGPPHYYMAHLKMAGVWRVMHEVMRQRPSRPDWRSKEEGGAVRPNCAAHLSLYLTNCDSVVCSAHLHMQGAGLTLEIAFLTMEKFFSINLLSSLSRTPLSLSAPIIFLSCSMSLRCHHPVLYSVGHTQQY